MIRPEVIRNTLVHGYIDVDRTILLNFGPILHP